MIYKKIHIDMYSQVIYVICCEDCEIEKDKILAKKLDFNMHTIDFKDWGGLVRSNGANHLVLLNSKYGYDELLATINHEAFHLSNKIMKNVGIEADLDNDEPQAYLLTNIFLNILKVIKLKQ